MFDKLYVSSKLIVTLALSQDNRKIVVRYFVNQAPDVQPIVLKDSGKQVGCWDTREHTHTPV